MVNIEYTGVFKNIPTLTFDKTSTLDEIKDFFKEYYYGGQFRICKENDCPYAEAKIMSIDECHNIMLDVFFYDDTNDMINCTVDDLIAVMLNPVLNKINVNEDIEIE